MNNHPFYIVDVFAQGKYTGNQLAVIADADDLDEAMMQQIAQEMNYSETTFIESRDDQDGSFPVRIFTPTMELPFAGHPTLGTAQVIRSADDNLDKITLELPVGPISVTFEETDAGDICWMYQNPPEFGDEFDHSPVATILGLDAENLDTRYPVCEISTGLPVLIVPVCDLDGIQHAYPDWREYESHFGNTESKSILVFTSETYHRENDLNVRVFSQRIPQGEDPATGSASGCLAAYLVHYRYFGTTAVDITVEQGYELDRPSLLYLHANTAADDITVSVGGRVIPVAKGVLL